MKRINDIVIFNSTPHPITFAVGDGIEVVQPDEAINAFPVEEKVSGGPLGVQYVRTRFIGTSEGDAVIVRAEAAGANVIVGSIIAAQAYPGKVVGMVPAPGYERVPIDQKRMRIDRFTVY